jgi:hypothetical protein
MKGTRASPDGDAKVYATMWPYFDPTATLVTFEQELNVDVPCSAHSSATIKYFVDFFVDDPGVVRGNTPWAWLSVDSPVASGDIYNQLLPHVQAGFPKLDPLIMLMIGYRSGVPMDHVYLLPGGGPIAEDSLMSSGNATDGVSLVFVRKMP